MFRYDVTLPSVTLTNGLPNSVRSTTILPAGTYRVEFEHSDQVNKVELTWRAFLQYIVEHRPFILAYEHGASIALDSFLNTHPERVVVTPVVGL